MGVLLAGGAARRFGGYPKGLATIGGTRIADRVLAALRAATDTQLVVANDPRAPSWFAGERVVPDEPAGEGPLAGIATALDAAAGAPIIVVAWDMPFVTGALLRELRWRGERGSAAVLPVSGWDKRREPLCAYYAPDARDVCRALLRAGERRAGALREALPGAEDFGEPELSAFGDPARVLMSVDTPDALAGLGGTLPALP